MKTHTQRLFERLIGDWSFSREISHQGAVTGEASFKPQGEYILNYREEGTWQSHTKNFAVFKEYQYCYDPEADKISVYFHDTRKLFFVIHFTTTDNAEGQHLCIADYYQAFYHFSDKNNFYLDFMVNGPKKNYRLKTHFYRNNPIFY